MSLNSNLDNAGWYGNPAKVSIEPTRRSNSNLAPSRCQRFEILDAWRFCGAIFVEDAPTSLRRSATTAYMIVYERSCLRSA